MDMKEQIIGLQIDAYDKGAENFKKSLIEACDALIKSKGDLEINISDMKEMIGLVSTNTMEEVVK